VFRRVVGKETPGLDLESKSRVHIREFLSLSLFSPNLR